MCCSLEPSKMAGTILYAAEVMHPTLDRVVHVLGYANNAESVGPNAMILPLPSMVPMGPENIVDTTNAASILKDMAMTIQTNVGIFTFSSSFDGVEEEIPRGVQIFESGSYTVVLAKSAADIPSVMRFVPAEKRPKVNRAIFNEYARLYPNSQFALCCWKGKVYGDEVEPLLWWYEPSDPSSLFLPGLDAHDGRPPVLDTKVDVDHVLIVGSNVREMFTGNKPYFMDDVESIQPYLAKHIIGTEFKGELPNGDWRIKLEDLGDFDWLDSRELFKRLPPLAA